MVLRRASSRVLEVQLIRGDHSSHIALIPCISLQPTSSNGEFSFLLQQRQFPLRLAFAMTINKAQGQSVRHVGLDLRVLVFTHGQLYVALSRATSGQQVKVLLPDSEDSTQNIVYPEVLLD
jgi:hypothetical protein